MTFPWVAPSVPSVDLSSSCVSVDYAVRLLTLSLRYHIGIGPSLLVGGFYPVVHAHCRLQPLNI